MLMEKTLAPTVAEAQVIVAQAEAAGVIFQVGHLERFNAGIMALSEHCRNPRFIEVHRLDRLSSALPMSTWSPIS